MKPRQCTQDYVNRQIAAGAIAIYSESQLVYALAKIGYSLRYSHTYRNTLNPGQEWDAKAFCIIDNATGHGFANCKASKVHIADLQEFRGTVIPFIDGYVWQI